MELENQLPTVFEVGFAFSAWSMPEHVLTSLGIDVEAARKDASFDGLRALGLSQKQIATLNETICGTQTVEGAPHLKAEHLPVFDCANKCGRTGERFIATEGHIRMMAAAQPFVSGAISKTINLPAEAAVENIAAAYRLSWELGLKANALYRDGSKLSQPLSTKADDKRTDEERHAQEVETAVGEASTEAAEAVSATSISSTSSASPAAPEVAAGAPAPDSGSGGKAVIERIVERIVERPLRRRLPDTRQSITHRFNVAGHEGYLTVGLYDDDGRPGELFITMSKEGSTIGGLMDCLGTAISVALQYGVPIESLVTKFAHQRFEPMGMTTNRDIPFAKSLVDYIFRWLGMRFVPGYHEANAPKRPSAEPAREAPRGAETSDSPAATGRAATTPENGNGQRLTPPPLDNNGGGPAKPASGGVELTPPRVVVDTAHLPSPAESFSAVAGSVLDQSTAQLMGDAPACDVCGSITVRNGNCYKCLNCGNSIGCS